MIIIIGGIIVASVLVFIFILLMKYKLHSNHYKQKAVARHANVCSQTNGGGGGGGANVLTLPPSSSHAGQGNGMGGKQTEDGCDYLLVITDSLSPRWRCLQKLPAVIINRGPGRSFPPRDDCSGLKSRP